MALSSSDMLSSRPPETPSDATQGRHGIEVYWSDDFTVTAPIGLQQAQIGQSHHLFKS